ncbi:hypothetical protein CEE37_09330 [candidate division LCP-89 bacterium B3_LCP]|uniref:Secretion system C-terminal sorting domain-containing protein n=1 Tax=candidate division LCP-89 bacterium B3_LCP TaxID=2012998 RepID=A0A532UYE2_UNCL8|nr:MAG: hypothetical protein CEE37_09330 [candidate division LCP-89 bacterium B3_LCP]
MKRSHVILILIILLWSSNTFAETITVSGNVSGTWSADTVLVVGEVRVPQEQTLVIEPGVKVLFQVYCSIIVESNATLQAIGTVVDSISFDELTSGNSWSGIRFMSASDSCMLMYCYIANATNGANGGGVYFGHTNAYIENCLIEHCTAEGQGGGICGYYSTLIVRSNTIKECCAGGSGAIDLDFCRYSKILDNILSQNAAYYSDGGLNLYDSDNVLVRNNVIMGNSTVRYGNGAFSCVYCNDLILERNIILANTTNTGPGAFEIFDHNAVIRNNLIIGNTSEIGFGSILLYSLNSCLFTHNIVSGNYGRGLHVSGCTYNFSISYNIISNNAGGIYSNDNLDSIVGNTIYRNSPGSGIYCTDYANPLIKDNTLFQNTSEIGGAIYCFNSSPTLTQDIFWENNPQSFQFEVNPLPLIEYCDIGDTLWPGIGNINEDPLFVNPDLNDYRLQWGSPCIDSGDPNPQYNDPDSTRADMGAFYFDQSVPVRILLSPHEIPYLIEPEGGTMDYTIQGTNIYQNPHDVTIWCDVELPDSTIYGPVLGPVTITIEPGQTVERIRTQTVPAVAPMGVYHYNAYAVVDQDTSKDSFMFGKLGTVVGGSDGWGNAGEMFPYSGEFEPAQIHNSSFIIHNLFPNPFNPTTTITFTLPVASMVKLEVFDISGSRVGGDLASTRQYHPGTHQITFDGSGLSSGIYIYRLTAGEFTANGKMILMK